MYSISLCGIHRTSKLQVCTGVLKLNLPALGDPEFVPTQTSQEWVRGRWRRRLRVGGRGLRSNDRTLQPDSLHSLSVILYFVRSYSFVVRGDSCPSICWACSSV